LHYNYFRCFSPEDGIYFEKDPNGLFLDTSSLEEINHLYVYAKSNPIVYTDSYGLKPKKLPGCIKALQTAEKECGQKYREIAKKAHEYLDWCEKAWWHCIFKGVYYPPGAKLDPSEFPCEKDCEKFYLPSASDARKACMKSPEFEKFGAQSAKCGWAALKVALNCPRF
jgi:RHS repeat-associated protein